MRRAGVPGGHGDLRRANTDYRHARCGIPEYWILALPEARLEVYRDPAGDGYQSVTNHAAGDKGGAARSPRCTVLVQSKQEVLEGSTVRKSNQDYAKTWIREVGQFVV